LADRTETFVPGRSVPW